MGQQSLSCGLPEDEHSAVSFSGNISLAHTISTCCGRKHDTDFLTSRALVGWVNAAGSNDMHEVSLVRGVLTRRNLGPISEAQILKPWPCFPSHRSPNFITNREANG